MPKPLLTFVKPNLSSHTSQNSESDGYRIEMFVSFVLSDGYRIEMFVSVVLYVRRLQNLDVCICGSVCQTATELRCLYL